MVSQWLVIVAFCPTFLFACRPSPPGKRSADFFMQSRKVLWLPVPEYDQGLVECLRTRKLENSAAAISLVENSDLQCIIKDAWIVDRCSSARFGNSYEKMFGYKEPQKSDVKIDASCLTEDPQEPGAVGFPLTLWYCLNHCEKSCPKSAGVSSYPINGVNCSFVEGRGCSETRICTCFRDGKICGHQKKASFGTMLDAYIDTCLNCYHKRYNNKEQPSNRCVNDTEKFTSDPQEAFKVLEKEWKP